MDLDNLDLNVGNNDFFGKLGNSGLEASKKSKNKPKTAPLNAAEITKKLGSISKQALKALEKDDILPLPENFEAYFQKTLLQEKDDDMREKIEATVNSANHDSRLIDLEKVFNDSFSTLKEVLEDLLALCVQMSAMETNVDKHLAEIATITNPLGMQNAIKMLMNDIKTFHKHFVAQADDISRSYRKMYEQTSMVKSNAMYDTTLGIYTRSFFNSAVEFECENGEEFPRPCAIVVFAPTKELAVQINEQGKLVTTFKSIARVVSKNIGAKDVLCYLGNGYFGALLKNVKSSGAVALCEDVVKKCRATSIFIGDKELNLRIAMGGTVLSADKSIDSMLQDAKKQLMQAMEEGKSVKFAQAKSGGSFGEKDDDISIPGDDFGDLGNFDLS